MATKPDFITHEPLFLTLEEANQLFALYPDMNIYSKYLTPQGKSPAYYDSPQEAAEDEERYGSVWMDTGEGLYRLDPNLYDSK